PAVDVDLPRGIAALHAEMRRADLLTESSEIADIEPDLGDQLVDSARTAIVACTRCRPRLEQRGPFVDVEPAHVAVDAEPGGGRFRKAAAEGVRAARELEPIVAFLERDREAPRRAVIPFDIEPPRRDGEIELQARRLRCLFRERLGEIERETGEI